MRTGTKVWLITAASLVLIGGILFAGLMTAIKWDFAALSTVQYETNTYEIREGFDEIFVNTDTADIAFLLSDDGKCRVTCYEEENAKHSVTVEAGTLTVEWIDKRSANDITGYIGINIGSPKITVYLPKAEYTGLLIRGETGDAAIPGDFLFQDVTVLLSTGDVEFHASASGMITIETGTGVIRAEDFSAGSLDLSVSTGRMIVSGVTCAGDITASVSTGKTDLTDIRCKNIISRGSTGTLALNGVVAEGKISVERSTGDVKFDGSDAVELFVKTNTGDVTGSLLTNKVFIVQTDTGDIDLPKTLDGGKCEIITNTGDIELDIQ